MITKLTRFVAALAILGIFIGSTGSARADHGTLPSISQQNLEQGFKPQPRPLDTQVRTIPPASSVGVQFVHIALAENINSFWTTIDHPLTNGNPNAIVLVTPVYDPGGNCGCVYDDHPIGVWYNAGKWVIFNMDGVAMPVNAAFNVIIPDSGPSTFVHTATTGNTTYDYTIIDNSQTNNNPNAIVLVTPNYNPGGGSGTDNIHNIGVFYSSGKWRIFNQDIAAMPLNASFNVSVFTAGEGIFVHRATSGNSAFDYTLIDNPLLNSNPNAIVFATPNWDPGGVCPCTYNNHATGVYYTGGRWSIVNQDLAAIPVNAAFNILVLTPTSDTFVQTATAGNTVTSLTKIDNALTNGHPNAIVFATPNMNPGGGTQTENEHNISMRYFGTQWSIMNQDGATMPTNAAFNILVPNPDASVFVHKTTSANTVDNYTIIDNPLTNNHSNAIIIVTQNYGPGGLYPGTNDDHPIGVYYNSGKWRIFNQDLISMPVGAAFNLFVPTEGPGVFVHKATDALGNRTVLDNPLTNGNPNAIILVTPNFNPGGGGGTYFSHKVGVSYNGTHWQIINQDPGGMPTGAAFNVYILTNSLFLPLVVR